MKLFSMNWFRNEQKAEMESLKIEEQKIKNDILKKQLNTEEPSSLAGYIPVKFKEDSKPYKSVRLINDVLTVVLDDFAIVTKTNATVNDYDAIRRATTEADIFAVVNTKKEQKVAIEDKTEEILQIKAVEGLEMLKNVDDFEIKDGSVYLKGINRSMPALLVAKFAEIVNEYESPSDFNDVNYLDDEYQSLKKFWLKCCLNPNSQSAEDLYTFLSYHNMKIDRHGNFYAYRKVVSRNDSADRELVEFIANVYNKVKAVWKKKPCDFRIEKSDGEYSFTKVTSSPKGEIVGNLETLYLDLPNMKANSYTSAHTGKEDYRIGEIISMPRQEGDDNNQRSCSHGFHGANKKYDYSGFGDTPILMIINPLDVLAVPLNEVGKLRVCRWFFATTLSEEEKYILDEDDFDVSELGDIFEEKCMENLTEHVQNSFAEEVKRHTFQLPQLTATELGNIVQTLESMQSVLNSRISQIN